MKLDNLDNWDQDVLLSNAGLPETNPLLLDEDLDQTVGEDFQKMLNEWENHIGSLQVSFSRVSAKRQLQYFSTILRTKSSLLNSSLIKWFFKNKSQSCLLTSDLYKCFFIHQDLESVGLENVEIWKSRKFFGPKSAKNIRSLTSAIFFENLS